MCLLCEELWMPFELPPEVKLRTFVADAPEPDTALGPADQATDPSSAKSATSDGEKPPAAE